MFSGRPIFNRPHFERLALDSSDRFSLGGVRWMRFLLLRETYSSAHRIRYPIDNIVRRSRPCPRFRGS